MIIKLYEHFKSNKFKEKFGIQLQDFCDTHLVYLIDEGFNIEIVEAFNKMNAPADAFIIKIKKLDTDLKWLEFTWLDVADHFITFYNFLSKNYRLVGGISSSDSFVHIGEQTITYNDMLEFKFKSYSNESIFSNSLDPYKVINQIQVCVKIV